MSTQAKTKATSKPMAIKTVLRLNIDQESRDRLAFYAIEKHSSIAQVVVDWIWSVKLKSEKDAAGSDTKGD